MDTIKIDVYTTLDPEGGPQVGCGSFGCPGCAPGSAPGACAPEDIEEQYEAMRDALLKKYGEENLDIEHIKTGFYLNKYPHVEEVIMAGYSFPIIFVNGVPRLAGGIKTDVMMEILDEVTAGQQP